MKNGFIIKNIHSDNEFNKDEIKKIATTSIISHLQKR